MGQTSDRGSVDARVVDLEEFHFGRGTDLHDLAGREARKEARPRAKRIGRRGGILTSCLRGRKHLLWGDAMPPGAGRRRPARHLQGGNQQGSGVDRGRSSAADKEAPCDVAVDLLKRHRCATFKRGTRRVGLRHIKARGRPEEGAGVWAHQYAWDSGEGCKLEHQRQQQASAGGQGRSAGQVIGPGITSSFLLEGGHKGVVAEEHGPVCVGVEPLEGQAGVQALHRGVACRATGRGGILQRGAEGTGGAHVPRTGEARQYGSRDNAAEGIRCP